MWIRKMLIVAAVAAPLALSPLDAVAQGQGAEQAAAVSNASGGPTVTELPAGIAKKVERGGTAPFGLARRYSPPVTPGVEPEPQPEPEPEEPTEPCSTTLVMQNGIPVGVEDCHGNFYPF